MRLLVLVGLLVLVERVVPVFTILVVAMMFTMVKMAIGVPPFAVIECVKVLLGHESSWLDIETRISIDSGGCNRVLTVCRCGHETHDARYSSEGG